MPIASDNELKALLAKGSITAITLDTNIFDAQQLNLKSPALKAITNLKNIPFPFLLSETVFKEVRGHLIKSMAGSLRDAKKAVGIALAAFDTAKPTRDELLDLMTSGMSPEVAAATQLDAFVKDNNCEVLDDTSLVDVKTLFSAYFDGLPPFSQGKKAEFPDALALHSLDQAAASRRTGFIVVSEDGDWRAFCEKSQRLYLVPKIEKALALITNAPVGLRRSVIGWLADGQIGRAEVNVAIARLIESLDVDASANATSGEVETLPWGTEVLSIDWPDAEDIDIIEIEELKEGYHRVVISLPVVVEIRVSIELSFSFWDSVDKESVSMGGRTIELDRDEETQVTVTIDLRSMGHADEEIELVDAGLDHKSIDVDLGDVDVFEPEDYDYDYD